MKTSLETEKLDNSPNISQYFNYTAYWKISNNKLRLSMGNHKETRDRVRRIGAVRRDRPKIYNDERERLFPAWKERGAAGSDLGRRGSCLSRRWIYNCNLHDRRISRFNLNIDVEGTIDGNVGVRNSPERDWERLWERDLGKTNKENCQKTEHPIFLAAVSSNFEQNSSVSFFEIFLSSLLPPPSSSFEIFHILLYRCTINLILYC